MGDGPDLGCTSHDLHWRPVRRLRTYAFASIGDHSIRKKERRERKDRRRT